MLLHDIQLRLLNNCGTVGKKIPHKTSMSFLYASLCTEHTISCKSCCTLCNFLEDWPDLTELSLWRLDRNYSATEPERSEISGQFFRLKTTFSIIKTSRTSLKRYRKQAATCLQYTECAAGLTSTFCWLLASCILVESNQPDVEQWQPATGHGVWQRLRGQELCQDTFHLLRMLKPSLDNVPAVPRVGVHARARGLHRFCSYPKLFLRDARVLSPKAEECWIQ